jgi:hypothetical protein
MIGESTWGLNVAAHPLDPVGMSPLTLGGSGCVGGESLAAGASVSGARRPCGVLRAAFEIEARLIAGGSVSVLGADLIDGDSAAEVEAVQGTLHAAAAAVEDVGVDHGRLDIAVA